jgi:hypothetical protein
MMMTAPRQKLGLRPNTPTRPSKPEGRANNPGQREFQDQENNEAKRGPEAGHILRANHPPLFSAPGKNLIMEPTRGRPKGRKQGWKRRALQTRQGNPVLLGDEDLGTEDLKTKDVPQTPEKKTRWTLRASPCHKGEIQERYEEVPGRIWEGEGPKRNPLHRPLASGAEIPASGKERALPAKETRRRLPAGKRQG